VRGLWRVLRLAAATSWRDRTAVVVRVALVGALVAGLLSVFGGEIQKGRLLTQGFTRDELRTLQVTPQDAMVGFDPVTVTALRELASVRWAIGVVDVADVAIPGPAGAERPAAAVFTADPLPADLDPSRHRVAVGEALASAEAQQALGLADGVGPVARVAASDPMAMGPGTGPATQAAAAVGGGGYAVVGSFRSTSATPFLDEAMVVRVEPAPVTSIWVHARTIDDVEPLRALLRDQVHDTQGRPAVISGAHGLDDLREDLAASIEDESGTTLVVALVVVAAAAALLMALRVRATRPAIARRRCLGASRRLVAVVVVLEAAATTVAACAGGGLGAQVWLRATDRPPVGGTLLLACGAIVVTAGVALAVVPAVAAARVDAARILRTP
jgi:hypothetical protein